MIDAKQLKCFITVADERHFARAADRLGVAQSAVSSQVSSLEGELGIRLLNRNKRQPISLTDAGKLVYPEARAAISHIERAEQLGKQAAAGFAGFVRFGYVASGVTTGLLPRVLRRFTNSHTGVRISVVAMETPRQLEAIATGELDVGLVRVRRQYPAGVTATVVHSERLMAAIPKDHALASKKTISASDFEGQTFISPQFDEAEGFAEILARLSKVGKFSITSEFRVNDFISAVSLAAAGFGVVIVPESIRLFEQPGVIFKPISDFNELVHLAIAQRTRESAPAIRAFADSAIAPSQAS